MFHGMRCCGGTALRSLLQKRRLQKEIGRRRSGAGAAGGGGKGLNGREADAPQKAAQSAKEEDFPTGIRTLVFRVRAEYPNQLDYREVVLEIAERRFIYV